jgi:hypothetical protein
MLTKEVTSGLLIAALCWLGGLLIKWMQSKSREMTTLRKYERLRAKVEVVSRLSALSLTDEIDPHLVERHATLISRELQDVLLELESDELRPSPQSGMITTAAIAPREFHFSRIWKPFILAPSYGFFSWISKIVYYGSNFLLLVVTMTMLSTLFMASSNPWDIAPVLFIISIFVINSLFWWKIAVSIHKRSALNNPPPLPNNQNNEANRVPGSE